MMALLYFSCCFISMGFWEVLEWTASSICYELGTKTEEAIKKNSCCVYLACGLQNNPTILFGITQISAINSAIHLYQDVSALVMVAGFPFILPLSEAPL